MSLLDELGLDPDDLEWSDLSLCQFLDTEWFYDEYENPEVASQVDAICLRCPVMKACAEKGRDGNQGVWGAIYWDGAGRPDQVKNAHKTEEVWQAIRERVS